MKIIIEIEEKTYNDISSGWTIVDHVPELADAIKNCEVIDEQKMNKTSSANINYILECAKLVDMETETTPIDMTFVAELIKRVYDKGYKDGQKALAVHLELCKEESEEQTDER